MVYHKSTNVRERRKLIKVEKGEFQRKNLLSLNTVGLGFCADKHRKSLQTEPEAELRTKPKSYRKIN